MFYPVCTIIALKQMLFSVAKATLQPQMSASLSVHSEAKPQGVKALKSGINKNLENQNTNITVRKILLNVMPYCV